MRLHMEAVWDVRISHSFMLMGEKVFERYIILDKNDQAGCLKAVLDENGKSMLRTVGLCVIVISQNCGFDEQ